MNKISRRSFLKTTGTAALAVAASPILNNSLLAFSNIEISGYFEKEFGIVDAICKRVLEKALSKGGDFADLFFEHTINNFLILQDGKVNQAYSDIALGVGIRTVKGDQVGYGFTQELTESSMLAAAATSATIADGNHKSSIGKFVNLKKENFYPLQKLYSAVPVESKLPILQTLNDKCFSLSSNIVKATVLFNDQQKRIMVVTSDGVKAEDLAPLSYLYAGLVAEKGGKRETSGWNLGGRRDFSFYSPAVVDEIAKQAVDRVNILFEAVQAPAGEMPVVLGPGVSAVLLHEAIGHGMEADFNRKKTSTYSTMIGKKVAEPEVNILDDGTVPFLPGSINVDDEGTPGKKTYLVENGILSSYMHDKISAKYYKLEPTGNGRRQSYQHYVQPRMRNTYMLAGKHSPDEIIMSVDKGIYVKDVSNGEVRIGEGDFAFYVSQGMLIEKGKLTSPIKDMNIIGNGPKMLANVSMVGNDFEFSTGGAGQCGKGGQGVPCGFGQPSILVKSLTVGGVKK